MNRRDFYKFGLGGAGLAVGGGLGCSKEKIPQPQEGKTYIISLFIFAVSLFLGFFLWFTGLRKFRKST